jgi:CheY-like chemotaxis protein/HPt (histidine-containing phosphotransfer) domain-containing protein
MLTVNEEDIDKITEAFYQILKGKRPALIELPGDYPDNEIKQAVSYINKFISEYNSSTDWIYNLSRGDLSFEAPKGKLLILQSLKSLQASLRHLTWVTQQIALGDFSHDIDFMGDFSAAFNSMTQQLKDSFSERKKANEALQDQIKDLNDARLVMQQAEQVGLEGFLLKPVNPSMLFDTIMQASEEAVPETTRIARRHEQEAEALKHIQGAHVLLVEDNEINQQVAKEILEGAGLNVTLATNGQEAVNAVKKTNYDAVLLDVQMPVMDGYTATRKIREWEGGKEKSEVGMRNSAIEVKGQKSEDRDQKPENRSQAFNRQHTTANIPIIAMTAHAMAGDKDKSLQAGMNGHVAKPIDPDQLFATLQKWIQPSEKRAATQTPVGSVEPSGAAKEASIEAELPESLPGFDLTAGLARSMGNKRLYRKLLLDFDANYGRVASEIRETLEVGDFEQAHSLVHNLKGLAGNLDATNLQAAAVAMEKLVKGQTAETAPEKVLKSFCSIQTTKLNSIDFSNP